MNFSPPISAAITACNRIGRLETTLGALMRCEPPPAEILVHVDGGDARIMARVRTVCPQALLLASEATLGPGGSRNRLIAAASHQWVASFDDDARPGTPDFFAVASGEIARCSETAILGASAEPDEWNWPQPRAVALYHGYACLFNKDWFERTSGFVPLPFAYCMEEVDLCLRLHDLGGRVIQSPRLQVEHEADPPVNSVSFHSRALANIALFWLLRCPPSLIGVAVWHLTRRLLWLSKVCPAAILPGLALIPAHWRRHHSYRDPVSSCALRSWLRLRRAPQPTLCYSHGQ